MSTLSGEKRRGEAFEVKKKKGTSEGNSVQWSSSDLYVLSCAFIYVSFFSLSLVFALSFGLAFTEFVCAVPSVRVYYTCYTFSCIICTLGCECLYMFKLSIYCKCYPVMHSNCIVIWSILSPTHCCTFPTCMDSLRLTFLYIVCKHSIHIFVHFIYS